MSPLGYRTRKSHFPKPDMTGDLKVRIVTCPRCNIPTFLGTYKGWYVHHCPTCKTVYKHDQCKHIETVISITPNKGD